MPFHENLRTLRLARGLTQPALAEKAGIEQSYLSKLENGRSRPSEEVLARLAQALEVKAEALQNGDEVEETRAHRWHRRLQFAGLAILLVAAFFLGRVTSLYPLSIGQVIRGAGAAEDLTQQILAMAPQDVEVIMLAGNGRGGDRVSISGRAVNTAAVQSYMRTIRTKFGGSFNVIQISPNAGQDSLHAFQLEYLTAEASNRH